ncbi:hypothetical protein G6F22_018482 [Rhizopus arrhizus]|nr:hypothetical protein G6F22_018482 [Rhizopus arrhizus]
MGRVSGSSVITISNATTPNAATSRKSDRQPKAAARCVLVAGVGDQRTANDKARGRADCFQHAPRQESVVSNGGGTAYRADDVEGDASQQYGLATIAIRQWPVGQLGNCQCQQVERDGLRHLPVGDAKFRGHARHGGQIDVRRDQAEGAQHGGGQNER